MDWTCPRCDYPATSYKSLATHFRHSHNGDSALLAALGSEKLLREYEENSVLALSEEYGVSRNAVKTALKEANQSIRGRSEAAKLRAERDPSHLQKIASLGASARDENGMAGVTGEDHPMGGVSGEDHPFYGHTPWSKGVTGSDHPCYRGGKDIYDAVKKCLGDESWNTTRQRIREEAGHECEMCGESPDNRGLDVHHIIPLLSGGLNEDWNLIALCRSCHNKAEWFAGRQFDSVLIE